jgi:DNA-binding NtrC family response regulator
MSETAAAGASILLVDDNDDARVTVARILDMAGYRVIQASNAREAAALLHDHTPDLVITDIYMPDGDGFEMLNEMRKRALQIPVIAISGGGVQQGLDVLSIAGRLGAKRVLYKPFGRRNLLDAITEALTAPGAAGTQPG